MVRGFMAKVRGLFTGSGKAAASGMYGEPTFGQVERLIAAAKGVEYTPPNTPGMYSRPTFAQFERLIAAVGGMKSSIAGIPVGDYGDDPYSVAGRLDTVLRAIRGETKPDDRTMYFLALEDNSTVAMEAVGSAPTVSLEYSLGDVGDWKAFTVGDTTVTLAKGQWVRIRATEDGANAQFATSDARYNRFVIGGSIAVGGNSMSLFYNAYSSIAAQKSFPGTAKVYTLTCLFDGAGALKDASSLLLPATTLANSCYRNMFRGCTSMTAAPELPAITLVNSCYNGMFSGCTSMTAAPELPATTLASYCYRNMFRGCTSMTAAPELPATDTADYCYRDMFNGCTILRYVAADFGSFTSGHSSEWLSSVAPEGEFHCKPGLVIPERGASTVPANWTIVRDR